MHFGLNVAKPELLRWRRQRRPDVWVVFGDILSFLALEYSTTSSATGLLNQYVWESIELVSIICTNTECRMVCDKASLQLMELTFKLWWIFYTLLSFTLDHALSDTGCLNEKLIQILSLKGVWDSIVVAWLLQDTDACNCPFIKVTEIQSRYLRPRHCHPWLRMQQHLLCFMYV